MQQRKGAKVTMEEPSDIETTYPDPTDSIRAHTVDATNVIAANYQTVNQSIRIALNEASIGGQRDHKTTELTAQELSISATVNAGLATDIHTASLNTLYKRYESNLNMGLTSDQVSKKQLTDGYNEITPPKQQSYIKLFCSQLIAGFSFLLWTASVLFILCWKPIGALEGGIPDPTNAYVAIFLAIVILISAVFNTWQEIKSMIIVKSFAHMLPSYATVRRDGGVETQILSRELVVGDIVVLKMGEKVPADIRIISCQGLQVNNSSLTGEAEPVHSSSHCTSKNFMETTNLVFYSSLILQGSAIGIVVGIGDDTVLGQVSRLTQHGAGVNETSLHREIRHFVWYITGVACFTGVVVLIGWGAWLYQSHRDYMPFNLAIINTISLIIAYVPEGLPVCVTLTLTLVAKRMYKQHVLVRNLAIIETFNSVSLIASDKTGTLTKNEMTVTELVTGASDKVYVLPTQLNSPDDVMIEQHRQMQANNIVQRMLLGGILCNAAHVQVDDTEIVVAEGKSRERVIGDAADTALYHLAADHFGLSPPSLRASHHQLAMLPFNSKNKLMISANQDGDESRAKSCSVYMKGAPEYILKYCRYVVDENGNTVTLDSTAKARIEQQQQQLGAMGKRVIGIAIQQIPTAELQALTQQKQSEEVLSDPGTHTIDKKDQDERTSLEGFPADDYVFYGLFSLMDPPRDEVPHAVSTAYGAGIRVAMVTGDHPSTASAIAAQVGILPPSAHEHGIHTLTLAKDELNRLCFVIRRQGGIVHAHAIGSKRVPPPTERTIKQALFGKNKKTIEMEKRKIDAEGVELTTSGATAAPIGKTETAAPILPVLGVGTRPNQVEIRRNTQSQIRFHDMDEEVVVDVTPSFQAQAPVDRGLIGLSHGFDDEWILTQQYQGDRRLFLPYGIVATGSDINVFDDWMWAFILSHQHIVFARTTPEQKLRIVQEAQRRGDIVAVTGDGTNDAPALKSSDLGIAMASGTEVAREAGDLMLLDNNFASIIAGIETGRVVADNLKKVCLYLLPASTWSEMWPVMVNVFLGMPLPLYTFQMILLSVITDVFDAMALVHEKAERAIMTRPPVIPSRHRLVNWRLLFHAYIELGMICSLCGFFNFFWYMDDHGCPPNKIFFAWANWGTVDGWCGTGDMLASDQLEMQYTGQSIFFVSLVICNWFNMFATRTRYTSILDHNPLYGRGRNLWLFVALVGTILVAIFITQVEWFQVTFYTRPVPVKYVMPSFGFGAFLLLMDEIRKWNWRNRPNSLWAKLAW